MNIKLKKLTAFCCAASICMGILSSCALKSGEAPGSDSGAYSSDSAEAPAEDNSGEDNDKDNDNDAEPSDSGDKKGEPQLNAPEADRSEYAVTFSAYSGIYESEFDVEISAAEQNAQIYYTTDGSDPAVSGTAMLYDGAVRITDRQGEPNVVSAADPVLFSGNFNEPNSDRTGFDCKISAPEDSDVDKCFVLRAVAKGEDGSISQETGAAYFIGTMEEHIQGIAESCAASGESLAVISISMNYDDLFDSASGIYVKGDAFDNALKGFLRSGERMEGETARQLDANYKQKGRDWEREAYMSFMECTSDGSLEVLSQKCGIRIQGNYSRSDLQKGFRLYARKDYGSKNFKYAVFGEDRLNDAGEVMDKYKTLTLRAGGNCAFTAKFNDTYWQSLVSGLDCETQTSRPCVVYINGEYWGLYVLQEDYSDDYFEDLHGVNKDDVVIYKGDAEALELGYKLDEGEIPEGEPESYYFRELLDFFKTHSNLSISKDYEEFCQLVDEQSVMDYFAVECWINNKWDWPGKNWSMWRTINTDASNEYADGRWRFMFYDVEFGGVSGQSDAYANTVKEDNYKPKGLLDMDTKNPAVLCFAYLMTNKGFREEFCEKLDSLSENEFEKQRALERLQELEDIYSPLYDQFFDRYPGTGSSREAVGGGYASIACIDDFVSRRADNIQPMIDYIHQTLD